MRKLSLILILALAVSLLAGCAGTPVIYYSNCTCPTGAHDMPVETQGPELSAEGRLKTGLYIGTKLTNSKNVDGSADGEAKYDVTVVAVTVDDSGVIHACAIDSVSTGVTFDSKGAITSDLTAPILTKNELGENYGMVAWGGAVAEWDAQAAALAAYAVGKTAEELRGGAVDETGYAPEGSDLATSATIYLGDYVSAIEAAVANAQYLGAHAGDTLRLAMIPDVSDSIGADRENAGTAQLNVDVAAVTMKGDVITSCYIDALQAKISFNTPGVITTDLTAAVQTKNQLGENYGMVAWGGAIAEWNQQAAAFADYVTGKTAAEVAGIAVNEKTVATEADLAASVTIAIGGFQALIAKAAQ